MRYLPFLSALSLGLIFLFPIPDAVAQTAQDVVMLCDKLAAHPEDPDRTPDTGVWDYEFNAEAAQKPCEEAVEQFPDIVRLHYQLSRTYAFKPQYKEKYPEIIKFLLEKKYPFANWANIRIKFLENLDKEYYKNELSKLAEKGNPLAYVDLGYAELEIFRYYKVDDEDALGGRYGENPFPKATPEQLSAAAQWFERALENENPTALFELGRIKIKQGQRREGMRYIERSALLGNFQAIFYIYNIKMQSNDSKDQEDAIYWARLYMRKVIN